MMERILSNWPLKLLSVLAAIILWFYVLGAQDPQTTQAINLQIVPVNVPQGLEVIAIDPRSVELRVRGRESALIQAESRDIHMEASLRGASVGENEVALRIAGLPPNLTAVPGYPATATVRLDTIIERQRPVDYERRGEPADGFVIESVSVEPSEVTVRGATSIVSGVPRAVVVVDTSGLNTSLSFEAALEARDNRDETVGDVTIEPATVRVDIEVRQLNVRTVPVRPVVGSPPAGYAVTAVRIEPTVVTITGDEGLAAITSVSTLPVDISGLRGRKTYAVGLNLPPGLSALGPASVSITVTTASATAPSPDRTPGPQSPPTEEDDPQEENGRPAANDGTDPATTDEAPGSDDPDEAQGD